MTGNDAGHSEPSPLRAPSNPPITVLLADDQELIRAGFAMVIDSQPDMRVIGQAGDGREAVALVRRLHPDVVLMDVRMPIEDGIRATGEIAALDRQSASGHQTHVIILTTFDLDEYVMSAIREGASGFLLKDASPEDMLSSIRTVNAGNAIIAPSATKRLISWLVTRQNDDATDAASTTSSAGTQEEPTPSVHYARDRKGAQTTQNPEGTLPTSGLDSQRRRELESLTERECQVLVELARGLSNQEIADKLVISLPTVKTHVAHILAKTGSRDRVQAVVFAYETHLVD